MDKISITKKEKSIWDYADFYAEKISEENRLVLGDGGTPLEEDEEINRLLGMRHLYLKREDKNETGSLKGRSLAYQVALSKQRGYRAVTISTSGNAGIATAAYAKEAGMKAFIFISPDTEKAKIADMQKYDPVIIKSSRAIRFANYVAAKYKMPNLRPSMDDDSIEGFKSMAFEIADKVGDVDAVFTFVTSGSSFIGMYRGFERYFREGKIEGIPKMYAVQSGEIFSIAEEFEENAEAIAARCSVEKAKTEVKAGQLGVKNTQRKSEILDIIKKTGGGGIYVSAADVETAQEFLGKREIKTSLEGCASFAGFVKKHSTENFQEAVCIFSGKSRKDKKEIDEENIFRAESLDEADDIVRMDCL
ncbi:MAG: pyridoxal-phosphate dependent enzyme [Candidatus Pacebacteria bacterium]|nr:pyridoxal-phosphate dependent enzyme [Candidatus Paceibacterota bacterium]